MCEKHTVQYLLYHGLLVDAEELDKLSRSTLPVFKFMFTSGRWGYLLSTTALKVGINLGQFAFFPLNFGITFLPKSISISKVAFCKGFVEFFFVVFLLRLRHCPHSPAPACFCHILCRIVFSMTQQKYISMYFDMFQCTHLFRTNRPFNLQIYKHILHNYVSSVISSKRLVFVQTEINWIIIRD